MNKIKEAIAFVYLKAVKAGREGEVTKHYLPVADLVEKLTNDEDMVIAAILHDTIEDLDVTYEEIKINFGKRIADLVKEVTKSGYNVFPNLKSRDAVVIKLLDRAQNLYRYDSLPEEKKKKYIIKTKFWKDTN